VDRALNRGIHLRELHPAVGSPIKAGFAEFCVLHVGPTIRRQLSAAMGTRKSRTTDDAGSEAEPSVQGE